MTACSDQIMAQFARGAWLSTRDLCALTGYSVHTVRSEIKELRELDLLCVCKYLGRRPVYSARMDEAIPERIRKDRPQRDDTPDTSGYVRAALRARTPLENAWSGLA